MGAVHLNDSQSKRVDSSATARVPGASPPDLSTGGSTVEAESMSSYFDSRLPTFAEAVAELSGKAGKWKR